MADHSMPHGTMAQPSSMDELMDELMDQPARSVQAPRVAAQQAQTPAPDPFLDDGGCQAILQKASNKLDGAPVLYATHYARPEGKMKGSSTGALARATFDAALKSLSKTLSSGLPNDGWIAVTPDGLAIFTRVPLTNAIGSHKGTIPNHLISTVSVHHDKKPGKADIIVTFVDQSEAQLKAKTKATYPALSPWVQGRAVAASAAQAVSFDADQLFRDTPGLGH